MKLLFSEAPPHYRHYLFPYAVWAFPEAHETPSDLFRAGFLPSSRQLDRFYLCRHVRVNLSRFRLSSENRRILRKGQGIRSTLIPRGDFDYTPQRRDAWKQYADIKFGRDVMTCERLDRLMESPIVSHVLVFHDDQTGREVGAVTLFLEPPSTAYYYYAFYDLNYYARHLGILMMTTAVRQFAEQEFEHVYLGTVYSQASLYKTQFAGAEFFNGFAWSDQLNQLKHLLLRDTQHPDHHLLESEVFLETFYPQGLPSIANQSGFAANLSANPHIESTRTTRG